MFRRFLLCAVMPTLFLVGCGGGGGGGASGGGNAASAESSGRIIDGYVSGATVFLDLNFNGELDAGEPHAVSGSAGSYKLELTAADQRCLGHAPVVVHVPVGAVDEENGKVTEAYQMVYPPAFGRIDVHKFFNISPLTSVVWSAIQAELTRSAGSLSCDKLLANAAKRDQLKAILEGAIKDVVAHYNISEQKLFSDFVAHNDKEAHDTARAIVKGLKKSFAETAKYRREHPDAVWARVSYHQFDSRDDDANYPDAWYRETNVFYEHSGLFRLDKVTDDLSQVVRPIIYGESATVDGDGFTYYQNSEFESRGGDNSNYTCDTKEGVRTQRNGKEYDLTNLISKTATVFSDCAATGFLSNAYMRYEFVKYTSGDTDYSAQFMFKKSMGYPNLTSWFDLKDKIDQLDMDVLVSALEGLPYRYDETGMAGSWFWTKRKQFQQGSDQIAISKDSNGNYRKTTTHQDGTHDTVCSTDGTNWQACS